MQPGEMLELLAEGERKAVAKSTVVAKHVMAQPELTVHLINALETANTTVVSHSAHALHTIGKHKPAMLAPFVAELVAALLTSEQWETQEQLAKVLPVLPLDAQQQTAVWARFNDIFYNGTSSIARTCALQALVDMAARFPDYRGKASGVIAFALEQGSKAMQARARNLIKDFDWVAASTDRP